MRLLCGIMILCVLCSCDYHEPAAPELQFNLAPAAQKVYACPGQMSYHLAGCPGLCADRVLMLKSEAAALGYDACPVCFPRPPEPHPPMVYIIEDGLYHRALCNALNETKSIIPLSDAIAQGRAPCPVCMPDLCIHGKLVYVTETGEAVSFIYHYNPNCKHLDHLDSQEKLARSQTRWTAYSSGIRDECDDCYEERHGDEEE